MKMPNFRLHDTQAAAGAVLGMLSLLMVGALAVTVLRNFDPEQKVIWFNEKSKGLSRFREPLIFGLAGLATVVGCFSGSLGFSSLGQKRNERQGLSWLGLALGAFCVVVAVLFLITWMRLKEPIITAT